MQPAGCTSRQALSNASTFFSVAMRPMYRNTRRPLKRWRRSCSGADSQPVAAGAQRSGSTPLGITASRCSGTPSRASTSACSSENTTTLS